MGINTIKLVNSIIVIMFLNVMLLAVGLDALYYTKLMTARIYIILSGFMAAMLLVVSYYFKQKYLIGLILIAMPFLAYYIISPDLPVQINGKSFAQVLSFSELYKREGKIVFTDGSHSYFFQAPYLVYTLSRICNITTENSYKIILHYGLLFMGIVSVYYVYAFKLLKENIPLKAIIPLGAYALIALAFIVDNGGLSGGLSYRLFGTMLVVFSILYFFKEDQLTGKQTWKAALVLVLLVSGAALGSPTACIFLALLFGIYSLLTKQLRVYLVIPLSYLIYAGTSYLISLKIYINNALYGMILFLQSLINLEFEKRVIPVHRITTWIPIDSVVLSISYLSNLLAAAVCMFYLGWALCTFKKERNKKVWVTAFILMFLLLAVTVFTYIGASTLSEDTSSDIRTIVIQFVAILLPPVLMLLPFNRTRNAKIFLSALCLLLVIGSIKDQFRFYPKSIYDPVNVVEDLRCGSESSYWAAGFLIDKASEDKVIISDYPVNRAMLRSNSNIKSVFLSRQEKWDIIAYNKNGLVLPSLYVKPEVYKNSSEQIKNLNVIYDDGNNIMGTQINKREEGYETY